MVMMMANVSLSVTLSPSGNVNSFRRSRFACNKHWICCAATESTGRLIRLNLGKWLGRKHRQLLLTRRSIPNSHWWPSLCRFCRDHGNRIDQSSSVRYNTSPVYEPCLSLFLFCLFQLKARFQTNEFKHTSCEPGPAGLAPYDIARKTNKEQLMSQSSSAQIYLMLEQSKYSIWNDVVIIILFPHPRSYRSVRGVITSLSGHPNASLS